MKKVIVPAVLSASRDDYNRQLQVVTGFSPHIHIDISDGVFSPQQTIDPSMLWWPAGVAADIHVMYECPDDIMGKLIALKPRLIMVHAEAEGDFMVLAQRLRANNIRSGLVILPETPVSYIQPGVGLIDHVTIFSGNLGSYGGKADLRLIEKVQQIKDLDNTIEIGWDGGVSDTNVKALADSGIVTLVSGGFIANAHNPPHAYRQLTRLIA